MIKRALPACLLLWGLGMGHVRADDPVTTAPPPVIPLPNDRVTLDFTPLPSGQPVIWVYFDRTTPLLFIVDSGTNVCTISDTAAAKLGLTITPAVNSDGQPMLANGIQARMAKAGLMQIGSIQYPNFPLIVVNGQDLAQVAGAKIDGIIGVNALGDDPVFLDFQKHTATFFYNAPVNADQLRSLGMSDAISVPISDQGGDLNFRANAQLRNGDKKASAVLTVDTGGARTIIPEKAAIDLGLKLTGPVQDYGAVLATVKVTNVNIPSFSLGVPGTDMSNLTLYCALGKVPDSFPLRLGLDFLNHFQVLVDFGAKKLYLKPVSSAPANSPAVK
jgi:predicted aspartyl protease